MKMSAAELRGGAGPSSGLGTMLRLVAVSSGMAIGMACLMPVASARPAVKPAPSAREVKESQRRVKERAAEVGRTKAMLAQANGELDRLGAAAEAAVERYNGEQVELERSRQAYQEARYRVAEASRRLEEARQELASFAAQAYRSAGYDQMAAIAGSGGPQGFMDRAGMVEVLAARRDGAMRRVQAARIVAEVFRRQALNALEEQSAATRRSEEAKQAAQDAVGRQRASVLRIEATKKYLERRLGKAEAHAAALARARERALELAEARRAKAAAERPVAVASARGKLVVRAALKWLGTPYSWGGGNLDGPSFGIEHGTSILGFDCSGLAMYAYGKVGVRLDHWTGTQWTSGPHVPLQALRPGDLVFFAYDTSNPDSIHHVGIFIGGGRMVEAPYTGARVRISSIYRTGLIGATRPVS